MNATTLPLDEMSVEEKLRTIEILWEDLQRNGDAVPLPRWHEEALALAESRAAEGGNSSLSWEEAKAQLRRRFE